MIKDNLVKEEKFSKNTSGHVKVEKYDKNGEVFDVVENHNLVVNDASIVMAEVLADPNGGEISSYSSMSRDASDFNGSFYVIDLPHNPMELFAENFSFSALTDVSEENGVADFEIQLDKDTYAPIEEIVFAKVIDDSGTEKVLKDKTEVFVIDKYEAKIGIRSLDTTIESGDSISVEFYSMKNNGIKLIPGAEQVSLGATVFTRSEQRNSKGQLIPTGPEVYGADYKQGKLFFHSEVTGIDIEYDYIVKNGLSYMGISDMPDDHTAGQPIVIADTVKNKSRFMLDNEYAKDRQPLIFPSNLEIGETQEINGIDTGDVDTDTLELDLTEVDPNIQIYKLVSVEQYDSGNTLEKSWDIGTEVSLKEDSRNVIKFESAPTVGSNTFTIVFKNNEAATVNFVADFPPGTPGVEEMNLVETQPVSPDTGAEDPEGSGGRVYTFKYPIKSINSLYNKTDSGEVTSGFSITDEGKLLLTSIPSTEKEYELDYQFDMGTYPIYQVGLFNGKDDENSKMFSLAGIGPIYKDQQTGMRVTWSITFD